MGKKTKIESIRDSFLKMRGGKLISIEAYMLAFFVLFVLNMEKIALLIVSLIIAFIVGFVFPILIGAFKSLAWLAAVLFSLIWAFLFFVFAGALTNGSVFIELLAGVIIFAISFIIHKNYSGLSFQGINRKNSNHQISTSSNEPVYETVKFCSKCGKRIKSIDGRCDTCDK